MAALLENFKSRLEQYTGLRQCQIEKFLRILDECKGCIAGSFPLETLLGIEFQNSKSDIDIWIPESSNIGKIVQLLYTTNNYGKLEYSENKKENYERMQIYLVDMFFAKGKKNTTKDVQIIRFKSDMNYKDVINGFDLTCTQVYYSQNEIVSLYEAPQQKLNYETKISNTASSSQTFFEWLRTIRRISKYMYRGFYLADETWHTVVECINKELHTAINQAMSKDTKHTLAWPFANIDYLMYCCAGSFRHLPYSHLFTISFDTKDKASATLIYNPATTVSPRPELTYFTNNMITVKNKQINIEDLLHSSDWKGIVFNFKSISLGILYEDLVQMIKTSAVYSCNRSYKGELLKDIVKKYGYIPLEFKKDQDPAIIAHVPYRQLSKMFNLKIQVVELVETKRSINKIISPDCKKDNVMKIICDAHPHFRIKPEAKEAYYANVGDPINSQLGGHSLKLVFDDDIPLMKQKLPKDNNVRILKNISKTTNVLVFDDKHLAGRHTPKMLAARNNGSALVSYNRYKATFLD